MARGTTLKIRLKHAGKYLSFFSDLRRYEKMAGAEKVSRRDLYPCLGDNTATTNFDTHYFYQDIWAFRKILGSGVGEHVDVGSKIDFVGFLTAITKVAFIDIRPLMAEVEGLECRRGSILDIPYPDDSVISLSSLHVAEHIGLGRYGDPLDPLGTAKACQELSRVLAPGGNLYFGLPVGKPRVCFNAHRIHSPDRILSYFGNVVLKEFSLVDDAGRFTRNADMDRGRTAKYGCGLFHFTK
jgi:SAM-dependent methyltransferase